MAFTTSITMLAPELALDVQTARRARPGTERRLFGILDAVDSAADVAQQHRRSVAIGNHGVPIGIGGEQLVVGVDLERLPRSVQRSLRIVGRSCTEMPRRTSSSDMPRSRDPGRVHLQADGPGLSAFDADGAHPGICDSFGTRMVTA